jgi:NAD-dependent dihydropyrimidine dehydrogenase PreA subunit
MSERRNNKGFPIVEAVDPDKCNHCRLCEINCPDFALYILKEIAAG